MIEDVSQAEERIIKYMEQFWGPYPTEMVLDACSLTGDGRQRFNRDTLRHAIWRLLNDGKIEFTKTHQLVYVSKDEISHP